MSYIPLPTSDDGLAVRSQIHGLNPNSGNVEEIWKDAFTGSIVQIEIPHAAIHLGKYFSHSGVITLGNGETYNHLIKTPAPGGKYIHFRMFSFASTSAPVVHRFYESPTVIAEGTSQTGLNFNRNHSNATLGLYHAPTLSANGTLLDTKVAVGTIGAGGLGQTSGTEWVLLQGAYYLSSVTNDSGDSADIGYTAEWYEL